MKNAWLILIFILTGYGNHCFGQAQISGKLSNEKGEIIEGANVMLKRGTAILSFTISDDNGGFSINLPESTDSLYLEITHLSYDNLSIPLPPKTAHYDLEMQPRSHKLPEISVDVPPVTRRGDTLIFDIKSYQKIGDETIEEVLKRLPGVTISSDGRISYNGLDISKFYVEGLDMMEGRYNMITRNLGIQHIRDIEILERHQPVRALDSIYRPENAAINLRLKSKVAFTGNAKATLAIPLNGLVQGNIFGFTKKQQFNLSGSFNSIGENIRSNYRQFYPNSNQVQFNQNLLNVTQPRPPMEIYNPTNYLNNREFTGGFNYLRKFGAYTQLKLQGFGISDQVNNVGNNMVTYFLDNESSTFNKELFAIDQPQIIDLKPILEFNGKRLYTKFITQIKGEKGRSFANNIINAANTDEALATNTLDIQSNADFLLSTKNKKAYQIKANFQYLEKDYQLEIQDAFLESPFLDQQYFAALQQLANTQIINFSLNTNYYLKKGPVEGLVEIKPMLSKRTIVSETIHDLDQQPPPLIANSFQNDFTTNEQSLHIDQSWTYEKNKTRIKLKVPLGYHHFNFDNRLMGAQDQLGFLAFQPRLNFSYDVFAHSSVGIGYTYFNDFQSFGSFFYDGFVVKSNRSIHAQADEPNRFGGGNISLSLSGTDHQQNSYYAINIAYRHQLNEQLTNAVFDSLGTINVYEKRENRSKLYSASVFVKYTTLGAFEFELRSRFSRSVRDRLINDSFNIFRSFEYAIEPKCTFAPDNHLFTLTTNWRQTRIPQINQVNSQLELRYDHYWQFTPMISGNVTFANYYFSAGRESFWTNLLNVTFKYKLPNIKSKVDLTLLNLLNEQTFTRLLQGAYASSLTNFRLNPRQVQVSFKKSF